MVLVLSGTTFQGSISRLQWERIKICEITALIFPKVVPQGCLRNAPSPLELIVIVLYVLGLSEVNALASC